MWRAARAFAVLLPALLLANCSTMPSWTKPSVWYDQITLDPQAVEKAAAQDAERAKEPKAPEAEFPSLAKSPAPPVAGITAAQQREIRESLAADRERTNTAVQAVKAVETPETRIHRTGAAAQNGR